MSNYYNAQAEVDYRRERLRKEWQAVSRRRRKRAEAVRRILGHLR